MNCFFPWLDVSDSCFTATALLSVNLPCQKVALFLKGEFLAKHCKQHHVMDKMNYSPDSHSIDHVHKLGTNKKWKTMGDVPDLYLLIY